MSESNTTLRLTVVNPADAAMFDVDVEPTNTAAELVQALVDGGVAPALPGAQSYLLALKGGHQLDESATLAANGVNDGATIQLIAPTPGALDTDAARMNITVYNHGDNQPFDLQVAPSNTPAEVLEALASGGHTPTLPTGQSYILGLKGGHQLDENLSLSANGVTDGATLQMTTSTPGAASDEAFCRERIQGNYREMCNIRCSFIGWEGQGGGTPSAYVVTYRLPSYVTPDQMRDTHRVAIAVNPEDPSAKPSVVMLDRPPAYHPNVFTSGHICLGDTWSPEEGLGFLAVRIAKMLLYYDIFTDPDSPANGDAARWYKTNRRRFPLGGKIAFPDPITGEVNGTRRIKIVRRS